MPMWNFRQGTVAKSTATDSHLQLQLQGPLLASLGVACTWCNTCIWAKQRYT